MKLLLVDDDRISIDILATYITPHLLNIDEVICAYDGDEAYDVVLSLKPHIIVTDIKMPQMDGIEFIKKIRLIDDYLPTILIISGHSDFNYARDALKLRVEDYILKPIDQDELIQKINTVATKNEDDISRKEDDITETIKRYISEHLEDTLTLLDIGDVFHYNAAYLGRLIKQNTGCSFSDYVLKLRVIKAQSLLVNTRDTIKRISREVGFSDPEHFTKRFKKITGLTPSRYRKQQKVKK